MLRFSDRMQVGRRRVQKLEVATINQDSFKIEETLKKYAYFKSGSFLFFL